MNQKNGTNEFDILYLLDATGSMGSYLRDARDQCINISNKLTSELPQFDFNFGAVFYRDPVDCPGEKNHTYSLKSDVDKLKSELASESATGGMMDQKIGRLIIYIVNAPAHGSQWFG